MGKFSEPGWLLDDEGRARAFRRGVRAGLRHGSRRPGRHVDTYQPNAHTIQDRTSSYLTATQAKVVPFYVLEKGRAFEGCTAGGKAFAVERLAAAVVELRNLIADAWTASDDAQVGYPATAVKDVESGKVDALDPLRGED